MDLHPLRPAYRVSPTFAISMGPRFSLHPMHPYPAEREGRHTPLSSPTVVGGLPPFPCLGSNIMPWSDQVRATTTLRVLPHGCELVDVSEHLHLLRASSNEPVTPERVEEAERYNVHEVVDIGESKSMEYNSRHHLYLTSCGLLSSWTT